MTIQRTIFSRLLDTNGDQTGTTNANGNYSGAEEIFYIEPPATETYDVTRLIVTVEDASGFSATEYGNTAAALSTGIVVRVSDDQGVREVLTDDPITTNAEWGTYCYDVALKSWGAGNEVLLVRWTFSAAGDAIQLRGDANAKLEVVLNDDLTGLVQHKFLVQGNRYPVRDSVAAM